MEFEKEDEDFYVTPESDSEYSSDDSDNDPTYSIIEETHAKFSKLSIKKKTKPRMVDDIDEEDSNGRDVVPPELDEIDEKCFEEIQRMIGAGQLEKLKVDQCKVYLRKNGLRLTGNKSTLLQRIKEHLEILNGGGEKKYPLSSFVLNCKGDACTGDVVLFEQKVYDMFNIASRSASGPPCGTRTVAGRIVKESYGTAKQQHTFTIEVLWSKGEKPLPPLHPLLIKGRNLYRLKTLRQKWKDEGERQKILLEKHSRGSLARSNREARIQEKGKRKLLKENRISIKESSRKQPQFDSTLVPKPVLQPQKLSLLVKSKNTEKQPIGPQQLGFSTDSEKLAANNAHQSSLTANNRKLATQPPAQNSSLSVDCGKVTTQCQLEKNAIQYNYVYVNKHASQNLVGNRSSSKGERTYSDVHEVQHTSNRLHSNNRGSKSYLSDHGPPSYTFSSMNWTKELPNRGTHRPPLTSMNNYRPMSPSRSQNCMQQKLCRYYAQGRCYFGDRCKFSHDMREKCGQRREERWSHDPREFRGEHRNMFYNAHIDSHWS